MRHVAWQLIWHNFLRSLPTGSENPQETDYAVFSSLGDEVSGVRVTKMEPQLTAKIADEETRSRQPRQKA